MLVMCENCIGNSRVAHDSFLQIDCFHSQSIRKYLRSSAKSLGWLRC